MEIRRIDHVSGKGSYIVQSPFGPKVSVTLFGPATFRECERYVAEAAIVGEPE
jgi:hypothetical protein